MAFVEEAFLAVIGIGLDVAAFQNVNEPEDCNRALDERSITNVAITPGLDDKRSRVWEKLADAFWASSQLKLN